MFRGATGRGHVGDGRFSVGAILQAAHGEQHHIWCMVIADMDTRKTTLYLPADLQQRLKDASRRTGRPQAAIVREALDHYLAATPPPMPTSIGAGDDPDLDARHAKHWLHERWTHRQR
jgi:hypothetical protein